MDQTDFSAFIMRHRRMGEMYGFVNSPMTQLTPEASENIYPFSDFRGSD